MNRIHDYCTSLAVSAMLTSAFLATAPEGFMAAGAGPMGASAALESAMAGLRFNGWHGTAGLSLPTTIAPAQTRQIETQPAPTQSPFTEIQFKKITQYWDTHPKEIEIFTKYSRLLGFTKGDEIVRARKIGGTDENKIIHIFARLNNGTGYYLTREPGSGERRLFWWVGFDFKVIAVITRTEDQDLSTIPAADAQKELQAECAEWAKTADEL